MLLGISSNVILGMFRTLIFALMFVVFGTFKAETQELQEQVVYMCTKSDRAYAYHRNPNCRHIKRCWECNHIKKVPISEAIMMHRSPCKTCTQ